MKSLLLSVSIIASLMLSPLVPAQNITLAQGDLEEIIAKQL